MYGLAIVHSVNSYGLCLLTHCWPGVQTNNFGLDRIYWKRPCIQMQGKLFREEMSANLKIHPQNIQLARSAIAFSSCSERLPYNFFIQSTAGFWMWDSKKWWRKPHIFLTLHLFKKVLYSIASSVYFSNEWQWISMQLLLEIFRDTTVVSQGYGSIMGTPWSREFVRSCS